MIATQTLNYLIKHKIKDAEALLKNKRYSAAVYLAGYAIEIALKYKICRTLQFNTGFPETKQELAAYLQVLNIGNPNPLVLNISQIRNHDLNALLFYSGAELRIRSNFLKEWSAISGWDPENRYRKKRNTKVKSSDFLKKAKKIIKEIS